MEEVITVLPETGVCTRGMHLECSGSVLEFLEDDVLRTSCGCRCHGDAKAEEMRQDRKMPNHRTSRFAG